MLYVRVGMGLRTVDLRVVIDLLLLSDQCPSEDAKPVYIPRLAKGLVEQTDRLVCRIVTGQEITSVMGAAANAVTSLLFNLKESGGDVAEEGCANDCDGGDDDFCCYVVRIRSIVLGTMIAVCVRVGLTT